jgi:bilirubin oxidase
MLWYHPHPFGDTGRQVYMGLAGLMFLDDPADAALNLPHTYGVDDLPLVVQDRRFNADRSFDYLTLAQDGDGVLGDHILVNGVIAPYLPTSATRVRLRLLNGSNRRSYLFALSDGRTFSQIGTDGGLLPSPVSITQVMVPPAGRADLVVDFSGDAGKTLYLVSRAFKLPATPGTDADGAGPGSTLVEGNPFTVLQFRVGGAQPSAPLPATLASLPDLDTSQVTVTRQFNLELNSDNTINGQLFDMSRIDQTVQAGATEIWSVTNYTPNIAHPWHVHGVQFRVLDRSTGPLDPNDQGLKDTVRVYPGETVRMLMYFDPRLSGTYMFHCHILEHEDMGMMGQFAVMP